MRLNEALQQNWRASSLSCLLPGEAGLWQLSDIVFVILLTSGDPCHSFALIFRLEFNLTRPFCLAKIHLNDMIRGGVWGLLTVLCGMSVYGQDQVIYHFQRTDGAASELVKASIELLVELDAEASCTVKNGLLAIRIGTATPASTVQHILEERTGATLLFRSTTVLSDNTPTAIHLVGRTTSETEQYREIPTDAPLELLQRFGIPATPDLDGSENGAVDQDKVLREWAMAHPELYHQFMREYKQLLR